MVSGQLEFYYKNRRFLHSYENFHDVMSILTRINFDMKNLITKHSIDHLNYLVSLSNGQIIESVVTL